MTGVQTCALPILSSRCVGTSSAVCVFGAFVGAPLLVSFTVRSAWPSFWLALAPLLVSLVLGLLNESIDVCFVANVVCFVGLPAGTTGLLPLHANIPASVQ